MKKNTLKNIIKIPLIIALLISFGAMYGMEMGVPNCTISGPDSINIGQTATYNASNAQAYYWTTTGSLSIEGSRTGSSVQIKCNGSGGTIYLTTFINGNCITCSKTITCTDTCGSHNSSFSMLPIHTGLHYVFNLTTTITGDQSYSRIDWTTPSNLTIGPNPGIPTAAAFTGSPSMPRTVNITAKFTYPDGCIKYVTRAVTFVLFGGGGLGLNALDYNSNFTIYPNPANSELTIENKGKSLLGVIEIRDIFNGQLVKATTVNSKNQDIGIDVKALKQGHYILTILDKKGNVVFKDSLLISK